MRPTVVGVLAGVVLATSCSSTPTEATPTSAPPIHRTVSQPFQTTWQPADDIEQIEALARSELIGQGGSGLVPSNLPQGASGSAGRLTIYMTSPPDLLHVDVYVSFQQDQHEMALSLESSAADGTLTCEGRISGEAAAGQPGWVVAEIRTVSGCMATNEMGLTFIEWEEVTNRYHVETYMQPKDALSWLASWTEFP